MEPKKTVRQHHEKQVRLQDVAEKVGVSVMTVSRVLRNVPGVREEVRQRVNEALTQMGYRANPLVSAYQAYIRGSKSHYSTKVAWLNDHPDENFWRNVSYNRTYLEGARNRLHLLGYDMEEIWLPPNEVRTDKKNPADSLRRLIDARGIDALIVPIAYQTQRWLECDWPDVSLVRIGGYRQSRFYKGELLRYNGAWSDDYSNLRLLCRKLRERGYRRIGLFITPWHKEFNDGLAIAGFLAEQNMWPEAERVRPCIEDSFAERVTDTFRAWFDEHRPDVVITCVRETLGWLQQMKLRIPEDVGLAHATRSADVSDWSGVDARADLVASAAIDLLVSQLQTGERGMSANPRKIFVDGTWCQGWTTRE